MIVSGTVTSSCSAADRAAVTVTAEPSATGFGAADRLTEVRGAASSAITAIRSSVTSPARMGVPAATLAPYAGAGRPAASYAAVSASRISVRCTCLTGVTPGVSVRSVHGNAGSPTRPRSASIRVRSSRKWTALTGVTPGTRGSSVNAVSVCAAAPAMTMKCATRWKIKAPRAVQIRCFDNTEPLISSPT